MIPSVSIRLADTKKTYAVRTRCREFSLVWGKTRLQNW